MTNIHRRIRTDYNARLHVEEDTEAKMDCFMVQLPPYLCEPGLLVYRSGADMNALWAEALATVTYLRSNRNGFREIHPPHIFQPFGIITARNYEDVWRETELRIKMIVGQGHPDHMERVRCLSDAWDVLNGAPMPAGAPWPAFKALN